ncbi:MAG: catalase-related domain-containing protein, partial [Oscillospiraceae bacterium]
MYSFDPKDDPTDDCFYQAGDLYRLMSDAQKAVLIDNTARNMNGVTENVKYRHVTHCYLADVNYGTSLANAMGLNVAHVAELAALDHKGLIAATLA